MDTPAWSCRTTVVILTHLSTPRVPKMLERPQTPILGDLGGTSVKEIFLEYRKRWFIVERWEIKISGNFDTCMLENTYYDPLEHSKSSKFNSFPRNIQTGSRTMKKTPQRSKNKGKIKRTILLLPLVPFHSVSTKTLVQAERTRMWWKL